MEANMTYPSWLNQTPDETTGVISALGAVVAFVTLALFSTTAFIFVKLYYLPKQEDSV